VCITTGTELLENWSQLRTCGLCRGELAPFLVVSFHHGAPQAGRQVSTIRVLTFG